MFKELIIAIIGIIRWLIKGAKTDLSDEINGAKNEDKNVRSNNYIIGIVVFFIIIILCSRC